ncbi:hypothetical protein [Streptomyces sp. NBC_01568]|uniref:hypothetical protein n=1 Tax=Streptomyces sp. NBC_01568 TaxID=2975882 RepID=UPI002F914AEA
MSKFLYALGGMKVLARVVPLIVIVILMAPAWVSWVFLSQSQRDSTVAMVQSMVTWVRATADDQPAASDGVSAPAAVRSGAVPEDLIRQVVADAERIHPPSSGMDTKDGKAPDSGEVPS